MKISNKGLEHLVRFEGLRLKPYKDQAGKSTIGIGHLLTAEDKRTGKLVTGVYWRNGITKAQAYELLEYDTKIAVNAVNKLVTVPLSQNQFDALVSFTLNLGSENLEESGLLRKLNTGNYAIVPDELLKWHKVRSPKTGKLVKSRGLLRRRRSEGVIWRDADIKPAIKSRTNQGAAIAATGQVINYLSEATNIGTAASPIASQFGDYAQWAGIAITAIGLAYVFYARWDDKRNGIR